MWPLLLLIFREIFTTWKNGSLAVDGTDKAFVDKVRDVTEALKKRGIRSLPHKIGTRRITFPSARIMKARSH